MKRGKGSMGETKKDGMFRKAWYRAVLWACLLGLMGTIFAFSTQGGDASSDTSAPITRLALSVVRADYDTLPEPEKKETYDTVDFVVRKCAHFSEYALLGLLAALLTHSYGVRRGRLTAWLVGTLYAASDELHQLFVSARSAMWQDVALDSVGVLTGVLLAYLLVRRIGKRRAG